MEQELHVLNKPNTLNNTKESRTLWWCSYPEPTHCTMSTAMLKRDLGTGDLCDNIGLVGVTAKWSYVTASPSHHDQAIPILPPLLFMHVGHPYIPLFKIRIIFDLLVIIIPAQQYCSYTVFCSWHSITI